MLTQQRVEAGRFRLNLARARIDLERLKGGLVETQEAVRVFADLVVYFRQRLLHLPGAVKTALGLLVVQTVGLQREIWAALTDLGKGKGGPWREAEERAAKGRRRQSRRAERI